MNSNEQLRPKLVLRSAVELAGVTLLVFATGWAGVRVAEAAHQHPVRAGRAGVIELRLAKSDRRGNVSFVEAGYSGWWNCRGQDWAITWRFAAESKQPYRIEVLVATPEKTAGEKIEVAIHDQSAGGEQLLQADVPNTGGAGKWKALNLGEASLGTGFFTLTVRPGSDGLTNLNVKSATLRPKETGVMK